MKKQNRSLLAEASTKSSEALRLEETLPMLDLILECRQEIEAVSMNIGLKIMSRYMDQEITQRQGLWGEQTHYRHGTQPGYVVFHGRKVPLERPRLRQKGGGGLPIGPSGRGWPRASSQTLCGFMKLTTQKNGRSCGSLRNFTAPASVLASWSSLGLSSTLMSNASVILKQRWLLPK